MPERPGIPCPICGEPLPRGSESCRNCGATVSEPVLRRLMRFLSVDSTKAHDLYRAGIRSPGDLQGRTVDEVLSGQAPAVLYLCTECGAFVSSADKTCGRCGAVLEEEPAQVEAAPEGPEAPAPEPAAPEAAGPEPTMVLCLSCGAPVLEGQEVCDVCGKPVSGVPAAPPEGGSPATEETLEAEFAKLLAAAPSEEEQAEQAAADLDRLATDVAAEEVPEELSPEEELAEAPAEVPEAAPEEAPAAAREVRPAAELGIAKLVTLPSRKRSLVERLREVDLLAAVAVLAPAAYVAGTPSEAGPWAVVAAFSSILAVALALAFLDPVPVRPSRRSLLLSLLGGVLLLVVPVHNAAGLVAPDAADAALLVFGIVLIASGAYPFRDLPAAQGPWHAALPALVALSAAVAAGLPTGSSTVSAGTWIALAAAVVASAVLVLRVRQVEMRLSAAIRRAQEAASQGDYAGAIGELDRAIRLGGERGSDAPWYSKGAALVVLGQYEEAMACIDTALKINPRNEVAWVNKGNALVRLGRTVDALRCYNSALKVNPRYEVAWNNKGNALARLGKFEDALRCYERALAIDASYRGAWVNKGYVLAKIGDFEAAARCADEALRLGAPGGAAS